MILAFIAACLALPAGLSAQQQDSPAQPNSQGNGGRGSMGRRQGGEMIKKLNLTDDQKQKFRQIRQQGMQQAKAIRNDSSLSEADKKQKLQELHKQNMEQVMGILTPEQKEQLKQMREERRKNQKSADPKNDSKGDDLFSGDDDPGA
jgi:Spy/CpxP family protein refolding chaperone